MKNYSQTAKILRAIAHPVRLQILEVLLDEPTCVCELIMKTGKRQACISQHLMFLRDSGLVKRTRMSQNMLYELATDRARDLIKFLLQTYQDPVEKKEMIAESNDRWQEVVYEEIKCC